MSASLELMTSPSSMISPSVGSSSRLRQRRNVLLPLPDGPMTQTTSPSLIVSVMPLSTCRSPKYLCRFLTSITCGQPPFHFAQTPCHQHYYSQVYECDTDERHESLIGTCLNLYGDLGEISKTDDCYQGCILE